MGRTRPSDWGIRRKSIYERDGFRCQLCGRHGDMRGVTLHAHHLYPLEYGGSNDPENLITVCNFCHYEHNLHDGVIGSVKTYQNPVEEAKQILKAAGWNIRNQDTKGARKLLSEFRDIGLPSPTTIQIHANLMEQVNQFEPRSFSDIMRSVRGHLEQSPDSCNTI